jgi:hypothetical protein
MTSDDLSDERLERVAANVHALSCLAATGAEWVHRQAQAYRIEPDDLAALVTEVKRLRAEVASLILRVRGELTRVRALPGHTATYETEVGMDDALSWVLEDVLGVSCYEAGA